MEKQNDLKNNGSSETIYNEENSVVIGNSSNLPKFIWKNSNNDDESIKLIQRYFKTRSIDIEDEVIRKLDLRLNKYNEKITIVAPIRNTDGELVKIFRTIIDEDGNKIEKKNLGSHVGDYCYQFGNGKTAIVFEGLEDAVSWYANDESPEKYTYFVTFSYTGYSKILTFIEGYEEVLVILDNDGDNTAAIDASKCFHTASVKRLRHPEEKYDCNKAVQKGNFKKWKSELTEIEYKNLSVDDKQMDGVRDNITVPVNRTRNALYDFLKEQVSPKLTIDMVYKDIIFNSYEANSKGYISGTCPFNGCGPDKFYIHEDTLAYNCFKCGEKGNAITYLKWNHGWKFEDIVNHLADLVGLTPPEKQKTTRNDRCQNDTTQDELIRMMNQKHALVQIGKKFGILFQTTHPTKPWDDIRFLPKEEFKTKYLNQTIEIEGTTPSGKPRTSIQTYAEFFLKHPDRRDYDGVVFNPNPKFQSDSHFNLYQGLNLDFERVKTASADDCELFLEHVRNVLASGNKLVAEYILNWCADLVQRPDTLRGVALVMISEKQGTGKGTFVNLFGEMFGPHFLRIDRTSHLTGNFNAHLSENLLLFADESFWAGDKGSEGTLKGMITEPTRMMEGKFVDAIEIDNFSRIIFASNKDWVVPAEKSDRRFMIFEVSEEKANDRDYFKALRKEWYNGGKESFYKFLLERDIEGFDFVNDRPFTEAMLQQKEHSMQPVEKWYYHILQERVFYQDGYDSESVEFLKGQKNKVDSDKLYHSYVRFCNDLGVRHHSTKSVLAKHLKQNIAGFDTDRVRQGSEKKRIWIFPPLDECRSQWEKAYQCPVYWENEEDEQESNSSPFVDLGQQRNK